jgi:hypothetical protein
MSNRAVRAKTTLASSNWPLIFSKRLAASSIETLRVLGVENLTCSMIFLVTHGVSYDTPKELLESCGISFLACL